MPRSTFVLPSLLASIFVLFVLSSTVNAAVFCVDDETDLQAVLTTAASNGDDQIQIVQGLYVGNFVYASTQANDLAVQGGWTNGCTSREIDPANTVLDGNQDEWVLVMSVPDTATDLLLHGLTLRNGGGVRVDVIDSDNAAVTFTNNSIYNNSANYGSGLRLHLDNNSASAIFYNNLFRDNTATGTLDAGADLLIRNDGNFDYIPSAVTLLHNSFDQIPSTGFYITLPITIDPSNLDKVDPLFVDAENGDLRLLPGSPMIDAGYPGTPDLPEFDIAGTPRVLGESVDIGAYEFDDGSDPRGILFIQSDGTGSGNVISDPEGIDCGSDCSEDFTSGTVVPLTATPDTGDRFVGWGGPCAGSNPECVVTVGAITGLSAHFAPAALTVAKAGNGTGTVTSQPGGIDCGGACAANYLLGTSVSLTATPRAGARFDGWSGHADCLDGQITLDADRQYSAKSSCMMSPMASAFVTCGRAQTERLETIRTEA